MPLSDDLVGDDDGMAADTLLASLRCATGIAGLELEPDGDIALRLGTQPVFVRALHHLGAVLVTSPLLADADDPGPLPEWLNRLNAAMAWVRFNSRDGVVYAELWLAASKADAPSLREALQAFAAVTGGVGRWLQRRCGGSVPGDDAPARAVH